MSGLANACAVACFKLVPFFRTTRRIPSLPGLPMKQRAVTPFQIFILVLSFYVLGALVADLFFKLPPDISTLLGYLDTIVCFFFFLDFCMRFQQAENKWRFMRWGWIDLLASVPASGLQAAKLVRAFQILRILRALKSLQLIWRVLFRNRAEGIVVSAIAPGAFASEMNKAARDHADAISAGIPSGRIGTDEDMAGAAIYLASRAGDYVVGSTVVVDGGVTHAR